MDRPVDLVLEDEELVEAAYAQEFFLLFHNMADTVADGYSDKAFNNFANGLEQLKSCRAEVLRLVSPSRNPK